MIGRLQTRYRALMKKSTAQITATIARNVSAGSCALMSVYEAPLTTPRSDVRRSKRPSQYPQAFARSTRPSRTER